MGKHLLSIVGKTRKPYGAVHTRQAQRWQHLSWKEILLGIFACLLFFAGSPGVCVFFREANIGQIKRKMERFRRGLTYLLLSTAKACSGRPPQLHTPTCVCMCCFLDACLFIFFSVHDWLRQCAKPTIALCSANTFILETVFGLKSRSVCLCDGGQTISQNCLGRKWCASVLPHEWGDKNTWI